MPLQIVRNDITKMNVDAIVSATDPTLLGDGGVSGAIFRTAGPELAAACRALHGCAEGEARITAGCGLPCRYVIHTVGPRAGMVGSTASRPGSSPAIGPHWRWQRNTAARRSPFR